MDRAPGEKLGPVLAAAPRDHRKLQLPVLLLCTVQKCYDSTAKDCAIRFNILLIAFSMPWAFSRIQQS